MRLASLAALAALPLTLALASCAELDEPTTAPAAASKGDCLGDYKAANALPPLQPFTGVTPPDVSAKQVWLYVSLDAQGQQIGLYQVDLSTNTIVTATLVTGGDRPKVVGDLVLRNQLIGGIRYPPDPIGPGGDGGAVMNAAIRQFEMANNIPR